VVDRVIGGAGQLAEARLLLHPEVSVRHVEGGVRLERGSVVCDLDTTMPIREVSAWYCPDIGVRLPTSQLVMTLGHAPCEGRFRLRRVEPSHLGERPRNIGADHTKRLP
jgi:hypothetical protein